MKLLRARIENFRLLKELDFEFAQGTEKNLTIIRAANESGKTTLLTALQWGLFGDDALPGRGASFRLSPMDMSTARKIEVNVFVEIDYEVDTKSGSAKYRLIQSVTEHIQGGEWKRGAPNIALYSLSSTGADKLDNAEAHIHAHLPKELREVFFTDGDRALSFIEGAKGDQKKRVESAIRSLLGLGVIEDALTHTRRVSSEINKKVRSSSGNHEDLKAVSDRLTVLSDEIPEKAGRETKLKQNHNNLEDLARAADIKLSDALKRGNREELDTQRKKATAERSRAEKTSKDATREHADLFKSEILGRQLLSKKFEAAKVILDKLHEQGKIPNQTIPVLEDRLNQPYCICGESISKGDPNGVARREHIMHLIETSRNSDAIQEKVTTLYYSAQDLLKPVGDATWIKDYDAVFSRRQRANTSIQAQGEAERAIEAKIEKLPAVAIQQLIQTRSRYQQQSLDARDEMLRLSSSVSDLRHEERELESERQKLLQRDESGQKLIAELEVAKDLEDVLSNALETMKTRDLCQVSDLMNSFFLEMIGADDSQRSVITKAGITEDFRIVVFGRCDQPLDPSQDLNGASRRALTIAFILALTKVSEVQAPNVIDTPLGMTSGYVKTAILQRAVLESSQLVLLLTHDEIKGCEEIIDRYADQVFTLTNPAHYPKILVNDPGVDDIRVIKCECNHREHCDICERRDTIGTAEEEVKVSEDNSNE